MQTFFLSCEKDADALYQALPDKKGSRREGSTVVHSTLDAFWVKKNLPGLDFIWIFSPKLGTIIDGWNRPSIQPRVAYDPIIPQIVAKGFKALGFKYDDDGEYLFHLIRGCEVVKIGYSSVWTWVILSDGKSLDIFHKPDCYNNINNNRFPKNRNTILESL